MASDVLLLPGLLAYTLAAFAVLRLTPEPWRTPGFATVNIFAVGILFYARVRPYTWFLALYVATVACQWLLMRTFARSKGREAWIAFFFPLLVLLAVRFMPAAWLPIWAVLQVPGDLQNAAFFFVGISYMAFRLSWAALEVRNGLVPPPSLAHYLSFAFFPPTVMVGPISRFSNYDASLRGPPARVSSLSNAWLRIVVGVAKYAFLANLVNQVAYQGLVLDGRPHPVVDWLVAPIAYYLFLYLNFSGFCDIAIGIGGVLGIKVDENFDNPFAARNVQVLWTRWHITLGAYMREVLFTPLTKWLIQKLGTSRRDHAAAISLFVVFVLIGLWHGPTFNFVLFGIINGVAIVSTHYYGIWLRRRLGKEGFARYQRSKLVHALGVLGTAGYFTAALGVFANTRSLARNLEFFFGR